MVGYFLLRRRVARLERGLAELADRVKAMEMSSFPAPGARERTIDRISVKRGAEIAIVAVEELLYVEACGDYVVLHTAAGKHIKEQTMKFYETSLPDEFVRVHRSYIVNTGTIVRIEQAGKENYSLKLRNGSTLRISPSGYKLLRERLSL